MYLIRCDNTLVAKFIFVTKSAQKNAQWNVTIPKTEVILVFVIDDKKGLFKTCSELLKSNWPRCTDSLFIVR